VIETKRKREETFESLLRRFNRSLLQSGKILEAKQKKYCEKKVSKNQRKASALVRNKIRSKKEYLRKIGKLPEEEYNSRNKSKVKVKK